ncbi:glycosyltransferase family 2 protein [Flaviaesturariibacter amylovorans]|uniref:Glycosyltransferase family 2 protein n=1 Tax=Flaviaesturariibacter amylovorans TaxID=1084520 RepID=A0ABP8HBA8_9BACT
MGGIEFFFWLLLGGVFFTYAGYAVLLLLLRPFYRRSRAAAVPTAPITLVIAAFNEAGILPEKISNTLALYDPHRQLRVLVVTDGSTDGSEALLQAFPVRVLHTPERRGKAAALNRAMTHVDTPLVVFSDANTLLNPDALQRILAHFADPGVGAVAGEKRVQHGTGVGFAEGLYWNYESFLKRLDAGFHSVVGAAGELFALRAALYAPLPEDTLLDDLALSLHIGQLGYRIAYEPGAYALEAPSASLADEEKRKVRIAAGAFQLLERLHWRRLLARPALAFQFVVRRWMRWVFCPLALPALLLLNTLLVLGSAGPLYSWLLAAQITLYALALLGAGLLRHNRSFMPATLPFYFLFMNWCMLAGWRRHRRGAQSVLWEKAR